MKRLALLCSAALSLSIPAQASEPLDQPTLESLRTVLSACEGGWYNTGERPWTLIGPAELAPDLDRLTKNSSGLDDETAGNLYQIGKALLFETVPEDARPNLDGIGSSLKCPPRPKLGVALLEYLTGENALALRGPSNALDWLGEAYRNGAGPARDAEKADRYFLRYRMHSALALEEPWASLTNDALLTRISEAGLRPYLDQLAGSETGFAARMILAEEALASDPMRARNLLKSVNFLSLKQLIAWENEGLIPTVHDDAEVQFWAKAWSEIFANPALAERLFLSVNALTGGELDTGSQRPSIAAIKSSIDAERVSHSYASRYAIPMRALVDPQGTALYVEPCRPQMIAEGDYRFNWNNNVHRSARRLYAPDQLPQLPPVIPSSGEPTYGWVILPAVRFRRISGDELGVEFSEVSADQCADSNTDALKSPRIGGA